MSFLYYSQRMQHNVQVYGSYRIYSIEVSLSYVTQVVPLLWWCGPTRMRWALCHSAQIIVGILNFLGCFPQGWSLFRNYLLKTRKYPFLINRKGSFIVISKRCPIGCPFAVGWLIKWVPEDYTFCWATIPFCTDCWRKDFCLNVNVNRIERGKTRYISYCGFLFKRFSSLP